MPPPRPGNAGRQPLTPWLSDDPHPRTLGKTGCHRLGQPAPESRHEHKRSGSSPTRHAQVLQGKHSEASGRRTQREATAAKKQRRARVRVRSDRRAASGGSRGGSGGPARPPGEKGTVRSTEWVCSGDAVAGAPAVAAAGQVQPDHWVGHRCTGKGTPQCRPKSYLGHRCSAPP